MENSRNIFSTLVLEQNPSYVEELEKKYNIELPPVFKAFVQTFEFGKFQPLPEHKIIHPNEEICYDGFLYTLEENMDLYKDYNELYVQPKLLQIANSCYQNGICLDIENDKILLYKDIKDYVVISENILHFFSQLKQVHWDSI